MRELLFRGKGSEGNWKYGGIVHQTDFYGDPCDKYYIIDGTETQDYDIGYEYNVLPETVGQYTGLNDARGKKIFEGDILMVDGRYGDGSLGEVKIGEHAKLPEGELYNCGAFVNWFYEPGLTHGMRRQELLFWVKNHEIKVIGNIHDNPELLES